MGADAFIVFYGVRETVPDDDATLEALEEDNHPLLSVPEDCGLDSWWGRLTDGSDYHILLGKQIGVFGVEGDFESSLSLPDLQAIATDVDTLFAEHNIGGNPSLHFQLEGKY